MTTGSYRVVEVEDAGDAACTCENCGWEGRANEVNEVQGCSLTPGDASPVGRCPECDGLVYLDKKLREEDAPAAKFFFELIDSVDSLSSIAEKHGIPVLSQLMHVQHVIVMNSRTYVWKGSPVIKIVESLPSGKRWMRYIDTSDPF